MAEVDAEAARREARARRAAMLIHVLGVFTSCLGPLVVWLATRRVSAFVDETGKRALNWQLSALLYLMVALGSAILAHVVRLYLPVYGFPVLALIVLYLCNILFCIRGAVDAFSGQVFKYPLSIPIFR